MIRKEMRWGEEVEALSVLVDASIVQGVRQSVRVNRAERDFLRRRLGPHAAIASAGHLQHATRI